jgi:HSP20 family molecular chaperone IbpA
MALPGIKKEDIKITINEDNISIKGESKRRKRKIKTKNTTTEVWKLPLNRDLTFQLK